MARMSDDQSKTVIQLLERARFGRVSVVGLGSVQDAGRKPPEDGSLVSAESLEQVLFDVLLSMRSTFERLTSGTREVHAVAAAVRGIATADEVAEILEFVEQYHDVAGVHAQHIV
jgi:hypothetical protein